MISEILSFLAAACIQAVPLLYGATGEIITEKSGNLNLGIPGIMYVGGISGIVGGYFYENSVAEPSTALLLIIPLLSTLLGAGLMSLIYCFLTVTLKANQNVTGLALTTLGTGFGNFLGGSLIKLSGGSGSIQLPHTKEVYKATFSFIPEGIDLAQTGFLFYLAFVIAIIAALVIKYTRHGLNLRAVGEDPATADAAGINVTLYKYVATTLGGAIAGLGGLYFVMDYTGGAWTNNGFGDRGWLAIAIVIFALWKPDMAILSSIVFGGLYIADVKISSGLSGAAKELIKMLPYVVTIIVLVFTSARKKREHQPPESLGQSYFREER